MLAATKQRKRGASADAEDAVEKPVLKRGKPSGGGGGLSLAEMLQATGRGTQNSGSDEDNAPLARNWKQPKPQQSKNKSKNKISAVKGAGKEASGDTEAVFELSAKRRVTVRKWKNMVLVDVREFYDDHGTAKPGKKGVPEICRLTQKRERVVCGADTGVWLLLVGISLSLDQWEALACRLRDISGAVEIVEEDRVGDEDTATKMTDCLIGADADDDRSIAFTVRTASIDGKCADRYINHATNVLMNVFSCRPSGA